MEDVGREEKKVGETQERRHLAAETAVSPAAKWMCQFEDGRRQRWEEQEETSPSASSDLLITAHRRPPVKPRRPGQSECESPPATTQQPLAVTAVNECSRGKSLGVRSQHRRRKDEVRRKVRRETERQICRGETFPCGVAHLPPASLVSSTQMCALALKLLRVSLRHYTFNDYLY